MERGARRQIFGGARTPARDVRGVGRRGRLRFEAKKWPEPRVFIGGVAWARGILGIDIRVDSNGLDSIKIFKKRIYYKHIIKIYYMHTILQKIK